jgi:ribosomal protein S18 acetylase RimI-like enzyme
MVTAGSQGGKAVTRISVARAPMACGQATAGLETRDPAGDYLAPVITDAADADPEALAALLSDAFAEDPVLNWLIPHHPLYRPFFRLLIRDVYRPRGIIHREAEGRGVALWLPPGELFEVPPRLELLAMLGRLVVRCGPEPLWRIHRQGAIFSRYRPKEPHFYLQFIGCRRRDQGRGLGSALLKQGLRLCDEHRMPAYLESSNRNNLPLYQRHGFEVLREVQLPGDGPRSWFMWRAAR